MPLLALHVSIINIIHYVYYVEGHKVGSEYNMTNEYMTNYGPTWDLQMSW